MGKKKKQKLPQGTPIEKYDYFSKEMEALQKHAIKVAEELNLVREQRADLETDRDNMIHYYSNAVYKLIKVEREIRRAERCLIHMQEMGQDDLGPKVDMAPYESLGREREGYVGLALDKYREVFRVEREVAGDRLRARKEAWERVLDGEVALMKVSHRARCREIDRIGETYTAAIIEADREQREREEKLLDKLEEEADAEFRSLVLAKNRQIHDMQKKNEQDVRGLVEAYSELKYSDLTIRYREEAVKLVDECSVLSNLLAEYKEFYHNHSLVKMTAEKQAKLLNGLEDNQESIERIVMEKKKRYKKLVESNYNLKLEIGLLEDYEEWDKEIMKELQKDCSTEVKKTKMKQLKIYHAMDTLRDILQKELEENVEILNKHQGKVDNHIDELWSTYKKERAMRNTIADLADQALRERGLYAENLNLPGVYEARESEARRQAVRPAQGRETRKVPVGKMVEGQPKFWDPLRFGLTILPPTIARPQRQVAVR